jgi:hypothetical protein
MVTLAIEGTNFAEAAVLARRESARFARSHGVYGTNTENLHLTGKLGEVAVYNWAKELGVLSKPTFRYSTLTRGSDVTAGGVPIEVKSYRAAVWNRLGGCVSAYQVERLLRKAAVIVFCKVPDDRLPAEVEIVGWVSTWSLASLAKPALDASLRANFLVTPDKMGDVAVLADGIRHAAAGDSPALTSTPGAASDPVGRCRSGHATFYGLCWGCCKPRPDQPTRVTVSEAKHARMHLLDRDGLVDAHNGRWPFISTTRRRDFVDVVPRCPPCWFCFGVPLASADTDRLAAPSGTE